MRFQIHKVFFLFFLFFFWPLLSLAEEIIDQTPLSGFSAFYDEVGSGNVAFMRGVINQDDPKKKDEYDKIEFYKMESGSSYHFPKQSAYCFILNHRELGHKLGSQEKTYLAVEIISVMEKEQHRPVFMFRNEGWKRKEDDINPSYRFEGDDAVEVLPHITFVDFFTAHRIEIPPGDVSDLDNELKYAWHGTIKKTSVSSWEKNEIWNKKDLISSEEFFENFKKPIKADLDYLRVDAFLFGFSPTQKKAPTKHVDFCTTCNGKEAIYLYLEVPGIEKASEFYITIDK